MTATITWLGHATTRLVLPDGRVVFIDPWLAGNPACPGHLKKPERCDVLLLTHGHSDHVGDVQALIGRFNPVVVGNYDLCAALRQTIGRGKYEGMNTGGTIDIGELRVSFVGTGGTAGDRLRGDAQRGGCPAGGPGDGVPGGGYGGFRRYAADRPVVPAAGVHPSDRGSVHNGGGGRGACLRDAGACGDPPDSLQDVSHSGGFGG
jgi:hypothetical protein